MSKYYEKKRRQAEAAQAQTAARSAAKVARANPRRNAKDPAKRKGDALTDEQMIALCMAYGHLEVAATRLEAAKAETATLVKSGHYAKGLGGAVRQRVTAAMTRVKATLALIYRACESDATAKAAAEKEGGEQ